MKEEAHLIGNGQTSWLFDHNSSGLKFTCNLPPFPVDAWATVMVDYKMMFAITEGSLIVPGNWVLGFRPKDFCNKNSTFHMKHAQQIRDFYTVLPPYVPNYTDFSCGHMACHYIANRHRPKIIHMYGFDSIFDFDLRSCSDFYLQSERNAENTLRLSNNWRAIWPPLFNEFKNIEFRLYGKHNNLKIDVPDNVKVIVKK